MSDRKRYFETERFSQGWKFRITDERGILTATGVNYPTEEAARKGAMKASPRAVPVARSGDK